MHNLYARTAASLSGDNFMLLACHVLPRPPQNFKPKPKDLSRGEEELQQRIGGDKSRIEKGNWILIPMKPR